jgi:cytochrome P450
LDLIDVSKPTLYEQDIWRPYFKRLREEAPVHYCSDSLYGPYWSISTYDLIMKVELNHQAFSNRADLGGIQIANIASGMERPSFVSMDRPEHTPRRRAVAPIGNRHSLRAFDDLIRDRTSSVLDGLPRGEVFDWVDKVSIDLTAMMLATMLDYPQERRRELMYWSDVATANLNAENPVVSSEEERYAELECMADAFAPLWAARADGKGGFDLITMLANDETTQNMSRTEFIGTLFLLIVGGNDTTRNSMSGGLLAVCENSDQLDLARRNRDLIPSMVSEMIRFQTPVIHMRRTAIEDTEIAGQEIREGDKVVVWYVSGNRDETVFENPDSFLIERKNARRHLSFGAGIHRCVGDQLAELQLRILWEEILDRKMRFEIAGEPQRTYSNFIRGFTSLPVKIVP